MGVLKYETINRSDVKRLHGIILDYLKVDISDRSRKRKFVEARMVFYTILEEQGEQWKSMGRIYGYDHSTVLYAVKQFWVLAPQEPALKAKYDLVREAYISQRGTHPLELKSREDLIDRVSKLELENNKILAELRSTKNMVSLQRKYLQIMKLLDSYDIDGFEIDLVNTRLSSILATMHEKYRTQK